jgi:hypothetical protein
MSNDGRNAEACKPIKEIPMRWLKNLFPRPSAAPKSPRRASRLGLEALEDRRVMSVMPSVQVTGVFLGSWWQGQQGQGWVELGLLAGTQGVVNSPYMDALKGAYGAGRGKVDSFQTLANSAVTPGSTLTDAQIRQDLGIDIIFSQLGFTSGGAAVPPPSDNRLYVVFTPPGVTVTEPYMGQTYSSSASAPRALQFAGFNSAFALGPSWVHYVVIPWQGGTNVSANGATNLDAFTEILSHEIAEAATGQQIADATQMYHARMSNGVAVELVGQPANWSAPLRFPGATPLPDDGFVWH